MFNKIKELDKKYFWIKWLIGLILLGIPLILAILIFLISVGPGDDNGWLSFWGTWLGAIVGGFVTLIGLIVTLHESRKIEKETRKLEVRPYINEYIGDLNCVIEYNSIIFESGSYDNKYEDNISVNIKNIGLGPMIGFSVKSLNEETPIHADVKSLEKDGIMKLNIAYTFQESYLRHTYEILVEYSDILDNCYSQIITIFTFRNDNGVHLKANIAEVGKPKILV